MAVRNIISLGGSVGVALILAAAGLYYDAKTLFYAGVIFLALTVIAWLFFWAHPLPQTIVKEAGPETIRAAEEARERQERRRKIIDDAREMVARHEMAGHARWSTTVRCSPAFAAVRPHLSQRYFENLNKGRTIRMAVYAGQAHDANVVDFLKELDRLEREWGLS